MVKKQRHGEKTMMLSISKQYIDKMFSWEYTGVRDAKRKLLQQPLK